MKKDKLLEALLRDALAEAHEAARPPTFAELWRDGGAVELIYTAEDGSLSSLGVFREHLHRSGNGRRLTRLSSDPEGETLEIEFVYGEYWVSSHAPAIAPDSLNEIEAIKSRFWELLDEYEED